MLALALAPCGPVTIEQPVVRARAASALLTLFIQSPVTRFIAALRVNLRCKCDHLPVRRPDDVVGAAGKVGQLARLAISIHVQDVNLRCLAARGHEGDASSIWRKSCAEVLPRRG